MCDLNGVVVHAIVRAPNCRQKVSPCFGGAEIERRTHDYFAGIDDSIPGTFCDNLISRFVSRYKDLVTPSLAESRQRHRKLYDRGGQGSLRYGSTPRCSDSFVLLQSGRGSQSLSAGIPSGIRLQRSWSRSAKG
jgi:hypothetical protein